MKGNERKWKDMKGNKNEGFERKSKEMKGKWKDPEGNERK
jgi:hypothetical protein